ncbi:MAG: hypothetical protein V4475_07065 [Pseudomonadota bacterium]
MFRNPFDGPRAKIERSHRHFVELAAAEALYNKPQDVTIDLVVQPNGDTKGFCRIGALPTLAQATIVADIVGAFRSSLDLAVCEACRARGATDVSNTYFAFGGNEKDWDGNAPRRMLNADALVRSVVRSFQPWKGNGNVLLYGLSKLAAQDKHVELIGLAAGPGELKIDGLKLHRDDGQLCRYDGVVPVWRDDQPTELFTIGAPAKVEITGPCVVKARFGFGPIHGLPLRPAIPILHEMGAMCEKIIETIEAAVT